MSAILCRALLADYWKPVQAGLPSDSDMVRSLLGETTSSIHQEKFVFKTPASPHAAAALEDVEIKLADFVLPTQNTELIIEGAGGCLVPLNSREFVIDLASKFDAEVILVSDFYLGSINHTLLTYEALRNRKLRLKGIIFNGPHNFESERIILHHTGLRKLLHVEKEATVDTDMVNRYAKKLNEHWNG